MFKLTVYTSDGKKYEKKAGNLGHAKKMADTIVRNGYTGHFVSYTPAHTIRVEWEDVGEKIEETEPQKSKETVKVEHPSADAAAASLDEALEELTNEAV